MPSSGHRVLPTFGFHNADVSKTWLMFTLVGFLAHLASAQFRAYLTCPVEMIFHLRKIWKILLLNLWPNDSSELVCTCVLIYVFRNVERRMGSKKFANFLFVTWLLSGILEVAALRCYAFFRPLPFTVLAVSPHPFLASCLVLFFAMFNLCLRLTFFVQHFFLTVYIGVLAARMFVMDKCVVFSVISGMIVGMLYIFNVLRMQQWVFVTDRMINALSRFPLPDPFGYMNTPNLVLPIGATEAAQREQMLEWSENYFIVQRMMAQHRQDTEAHLPPLPINARWFRSLFSNTFQQPAENVSNEVSEELVETLVSMGFNNRQRVMEVLRNVDNDLNVAALILSQNFGDAS